MSSACSPSAGWRLVSPWYRWPRPGLPDDGRVARPAIQKLAGDDFIQQFLARPQRSLRYDEFIDVVHGHDLVRADQRSRLATLLALNRKGRPWRNDDGAKYGARPAPSRLRKLYQPTHDRHYVVSCELHCDEPGFPRVARHKVCEAGFVLRRRRSVVPEGVGPKALEARVAGVRTLEAELYELQQLQARSTDAALSATQREQAAQRLAQRAAAAGAASGTALIEFARAQLTQGRDAFEAWQAEQGIGVRIEGWFPEAEAAAAAGPRGVRGAWRALEGDALLADLASGEQTYPLYLLTPDPRQTTHDAAGRTLYYGVVPTADMQHDAAGQPHLDDESTYELHCFVRAHRDCPPRRGQRPDCNGPLVWSRPSEAFRLAAPFDVLGSANRPVTIKMPDLRELAAQAALQPRGRLSPVRFVQPQHMGTDGELGGASICSFSIPLITIVALFVLNLFLPIVVFLFQLWFLLLLRFCIPPRLKLDLALDAALAALPPGVDLEADGAVNLDGSPLSSDALHAKLAQSLKDQFAAECGPMHDMAGEGSQPQLDGLSNTALAGLHEDFGDLAGQQPDAEIDLDLASPDAVRLQETGEALSWEPEVTPVWPVRRST